MGKKIISILLSFILMILMAPVSANAAGNLSRSTAETVAISHTNFPDSEFRRYLTAVYDQDGNGYLDPSQVYTIGYGDSDTLHEYTIADLTGIERFPNLKYMNCSYMDIRQLDVSRNTKLEILICSGLPITSLNLKNNSELRELHCAETSLTSLDVSKNTKLTTLTCCDTDIKNLDLRNNHTLDDVYISYDKLQSIKLPTDFSGWLLLELENLSSGSVSLSKIQNVNFAQSKSIAYHAQTNSLDLDELPSADMSVIGGFYRYWAPANSGLKFGIDFYSEDGMYNRASVSYCTHVQSYGWQNSVSDGVVAGTQGQAKRLEAIRIRTNDPSIGIRYTTHVQTYGWLPWVSNGEMSGTEGEAKRLEAIKIELTGYDQDKYDVYYRVHAQSYGWLGWAKNGEPAGTAGYAKRLEAIQIRLLKKGESFDQNMDGIKSARKEAYIAKAGTSSFTSNSSAVSVAYKTHVQTYGWQGWKYNGQISGTTGQAKRLEGIRIQLTNKPYSGSISYTTHVQTYGWQGDINQSSTWKSDGEMSGTTGEAKRLEAIRIRLNGEMEQHYDVYYRVHAQTYGWLGWAKNGEPAGTAGYAKRLEGIQIILVPKGGRAPANNYGGVVTVRSKAYISKTGK